MRPLLCSALLFLGLHTPFPGVAGEIADEPRPEQYVLISFDGAHDNAQWRRSADMAEKTGARFTYFLSCTFLLTRDNKAKYTAPGHGPGRSNVGFAKDTAEVKERLAHIWSAHTNGHEIASHGCGHFDGSAWSKTDWSSEFASFDHILRNAHSLNALAAKPDRWDRMADAVTGFRAPYLATNANMMAVLRRNGFGYDASTVVKGPQLPRNDNGLALIPLPLMPEGPAGRPIIAMDYNWYVRHSAAMERPSEAAVFEERAYGALKAMFQHEYSGARRPVQAGFHFTLMNGGAYWNALERFLEETCGMEDVACVPIRDYLAIHSSECGELRCGF